MKQTKRVMPEENFYLSKSGKYFFDYNWYLEHTTCRFVEYNLEFEKPNLEATFDGLLKAWWLCDMTCFFELSWHQALDKLVWKLEQTDAFWADNLQSNTLFLDLRMKQKVLCDWLLTFSRYMTLPTSISGPLSFCTLLYIIDQLLPNVF